MTSKQAKCKHKHIIINIQQVQCYGFEGDIKQELNATCYACGYEWEWPNDKFVGKEYIEKLFEKIIVNRFIRHSKNLPF